jgi:hypothetical protein
MTSIRSSFLLGLALLCAAACGDDDSGNDADRLGVGAECTRNDDCYQSPRDGGISQTCLPFKGGYCGVRDCSVHEDCPQGSACVTHEDSRNYCFRLCADKPECNVNRTVDNEANCSSNIVYVDDDKTLGKACVPPSSTR